MGVVCVYNYPVPDGKTGQQVVDELQTRVEQLGGVKSSNYTVDCETYQSKLSGAYQNRCVYVLQNSDQPASCFAILDTNQCLVADSLFYLLMTKLKDFYLKVKNYKVEVKGIRYTLSDFVVKIGSVVTGGTTSFKGILVEVEYTPCVVPQECWNLIGEFSQGILGNCVDTSQLTSCTTDTYKPSDTVMQYLQHFRNIRKESQLQGSQSQGVQL